VGEGSLNRHVLVGNVNCQPRGGGGQNLKKKKKTLGKKMLSGKSLTLL